MFIISLHTFYSSSCSCCRIYIAHYYCSRSPAHSDSTVLTSSIISWTGCLVYSMTAICCAFVIAQIRAIWLIGWTGTVCIIVRFIIKDHGCFFVTVFIHRHLLMWIVALLSFMSWTCFVVFSTFLNVLVRDSCFFLL